MRGPSFAALAIALLSGCSGKDQTFEVAYANEWRFSVAGPISGYVVITNRSDTPLPLDSLEVVAVTDDHPAASVRVTAPHLAVALQPGQAVGVLTPLSQTSFAKANIVADTQIDNTSDLLTLAVDDAPPGTYDIHAEAELAIDHASVKLPLTIHVVPGPTIFADPEAATRLKVSR